MVKREEFYYHSRDDINQIHAVKWIPDREKPLFILQIIHGMAEYALCYEEFATFLANKGVLVVAEDHLGHGHSVETGGKHGFFCRQDPATTVVRDIHRLRKQIQKEYPQVPYYMLGHSMGSFILRNYLCFYGEGLKGAIILGTGNQPKIMIGFGKFFSRFLSIFQGWKHESGIFNSIAFGAYNKRIEKPRTIMDWLTRDIERVDRYMADPLCGFTFTVNGFYTLFDLVSRLHVRENLERMPKNLPVLIAAGTEDPVGNYGKWVKEVYEKFLEVGMEDVTLRMYEGDRHELLHELDRQAVFEYIYEWINAIEKK